MTQDSSIKTEIDNLSKQYRTYIGRLKNLWFARNRVHSSVVYELMSPAERAEVDLRIAEWSKYITPHAETWWRERGYGVVWPDNDSEPMQIFKLKNV